MLWLLRSITSILFKTAKDVDRKGPVFPNRVNNKCLAIMYYILIYRDILYGYKILLLSWKLKVH